MRRLVCNIISVIHSFIRFSLLKLFHMKGLQFSILERFSPNVVVEINQNALLDIGNGVRVHSGSKLKVRTNARIKIGAGVKVNYNCIFIARNSIEIGNGTEFGPNVFIYDHDHDYRAGLKTNRFISAPIAIGNNCWIGANTVILRGTTIGDNCVIGAGSVVKGTVPDNSVYVQKRVSEIKNA